MTKDLETLQNSILFTALCFSLLSVCSTIGTTTYFNFDLSVTTLDPKTMGFTISGEASAGSQLGRSVRTAGDVNKDGYDDIIIAANTYGTNKGRAYVIYGGKTVDLVNMDLTTALDPHTTGFTITGGASYSLGYSVSTAGDVDGDGYGDIIVGASGWSSNRGAVFIIYGGEKTSMQNIDLSSFTLSPSTTGFMLQGSATSDNLGFSVSTAGDINKDGYDDIIVGTMDYNGRQGRAYVIYGGEKSTMQNWDFSSQTLLPSTTGFTLTGPTGSQFAWSVNTAGDVNKDGYDDIIVGANAMTTGALNSRGAAYIVYGGEKSDMQNFNFGSTSLTPSTTGFTISGSAYNSQVGISVSTAGDIDNDGYADIIVGAYGENSLQGIAYVVYGGEKPSMKNYDFSGSATLTPSTTGFTIRGAVANGLFGWPLSLAGDLNKDGYNDLLIGAYGTSSNKGVAYIIYGGPKSSRQHINLSGVTLNSLTNGFQISGNAAGDQFAVSVNIAGDINGDGYKDIIIGANKRNSNTGAVYVIHTACAPCWDCSTANCDECLSSASVCTACTNPNNLYQSTCIPTCPDTFFSNNYVCEGCSTNCNHCSSSSICTECVIPSVLYQSKCIATCPEVTFESSGQCLPCLTADCKHCSSSSVCTECYSPNLLYQGQCYSSCPDTTFKASTTACQKCPTDCNHCSSSSVCTECVSPSRLYKDQCYSPCPDTTFAASTTACQDCSTNCNHCSSSSVCTECVSPSRLYKDQCYSPCPDTTFAASMTTCEDCSTGCNHCSSSSVCTECVSTYLLYEDQCYSPCPDTTFAASATTCEDCSTNCNHCSSSSVCTECVSPFLLYRSECISTCPVSTAISPGKCEDCPNNCYACTSPNSCDVCSPGYILSDSLCIAFSVRQAQEKASQAISSATQVIGGIVCIGSVTFPATALVSTIVQNTRYLNLSVTAELSEIYKTWNTDLISWDVPNLISDFDHFETSPVLFSRYDIGSSFLNNFWPTLVNIGIGLATFITCFVLKKIFQEAKYEGWAYSLVQKLLMGSFNFTLIQAYACLDNILFYLVIDVKTNPFNSFFSWASLISASVFLALGCLLIFFNFWTVKKYQRIKSQNVKDLDAFNEKNKYWELFYSDFNDEDLWSQSFFAFLIMRSALSSFIVTVLYDYPLMQTSFLICLDAGAIGFLFLKEPFQTYRGTLCQYYFETITLLVHICTFLLGYQDSLKTSSDTLRTVLSTGIIYLNTALVSGSIGFMFIEIYKTLSERRRARKLKQSGTVPVQIASEDHLDTQNLAPNMSFQTEGQRKPETWVNNNEQTTSFENFHFSSGFRNNDFHLEPSQARDFTPLTDDSFLPEMNPNNRIDQSRELSQTSILVRPMPRSLRQNPQKRRIRMSGNKIYPAHFVNTEGDWSLNQNHN